MCIPIIIHGLLSASKWCTIALLNNYSTTFSNINVHINMKKIFDTLLDGSVCVLIVTIMQQNFTPQLWWWPLAKVQRILCEAVTSDWLQPDQNLKLKTRSKIHIRGITLLIHDSFYISFILTKDFAKLKVFSRPKVSFVLRLTLIFNKYPTW